MELVPGGHKEEVDYVTEPKPPSFIFYFCGWVLPYLPAQKLESTTWELAWVYKITKRVFYLSVEWITIQIGMMTNWTEGSLLLWRVPIYTVSVDYIIQSRNP